MRWFWLLLLPVWAQADPLASCTNIGGGLTSTSYTVAGTTYNICSGCGDGETIADVNGLALNSGDAVLFKAGETFTISSESNRLNMVSGVLYGRYGDGANPIIQGSAGLTFSVSFRGLVEADGDSNVTLDGIDLDNSPSFGLMFRDADVTSTSNLTITNVDGCGACYIRGTDHVVDKIVVTAADGGPHESITFTDANGYVLSNSRSIGNGHAAVNNKGNARNGEIFGSEFSTTTNDPIFYFERAENIHAHDNWIHDTTGNNKPLMSIGLENLGDSATHYNRNIQINDNVIETSGRYGVNIWIKYDVGNPTAGADQLVDSLNIHHNSIINTNNEATTYWHAINVSDNRDDNGGVGSDPDDWSNNVIRNNIIWDTGAADGINFSDGTQAGFTVEYNLYETGEGGGADLGTNTITTGTAPFVDLANDDFDPAGAALSAGSDGSDVGATIQWTCGLGTDPNPDPTLNPIITAKPDPHVTDSLETHFPDHLWVMNNATGGTTIDDEGSGTACDLTINGATQSSDSLGKYWVFNASEMDTMTSSCADPPTTTGITCVVFKYPVTPSEVQTPVSWGDADDAFQVAAINIVNGSGNARAGICAGPSSCSGNLNTGPASITDDNLNMACVRQSDSLNDIWINDSGWQVSNWNGAFDWSQIDKFTVGAQGRSATDQYVTGYVYAVFSYDGNKTDAEMSTIYNDSGSGGDPWAQIGIDQSGTPTVDPRGTDKVAGGIVQ